MVLLKRRGEALTEDILPPLPPGEKPRISGKEKTVGVGDEKKKEDKKKKGFLAGLFKKKKKPVSEPTIPAPIPTPITPSTPSTPESPSNISLEEVRRSLGLEPAPTEIPEPERIRGEKEETKGVEKKKEGKKKEGVEEPCFELPDIEEPSELIGGEPSLGEEGGVEEPPRIKPRDKELEKKAKKEETKKEEEKRKGTKRREAVKRKVGVKKKSEKKASKKKQEKSVKLDSEWIKEPGPLQRGVVEEKSEFLEDVKPRVELLEEPPKEDFLRDIPPEEVKELAKALKRKRFAEKKGIELESDELGRGSEQGVVEEEMLIDESPEDEVKEIKKRIKQGLLSERRQGERVVEEKKEQGVGVAQSKAQEEPRGKDKITHATKLIRAVEAELREKIRKEELAKLEKEFAAQRKKLEADVRLVEQQKIRVAGMMNKYDFKMKQLIKEKEGLRKEKEKFRKEKKEAEELLKKLPALRKDYEKLSKKMHRIYEKLEEYRKAEKTLLKLEEEIRNKEEALRKAQKVLEETEKKIKEKGFAEYLETELKGESIVSPRLEEKDILKASHLDMYNMIDECKALIRQRNLVEAKKLYMKLRDAYTAAKLKEHDKELLHTAIRELYDDIKLAEMEESGL